MQPRKKLENLLNIELKLSISDKKKILYAINVILSEATKLTLLLIISTVIGFVNEFLLSSCLLFLTRPFIGGIHFKSFWKCFLFTSLYYYITIFVKFDLSPLHSLSVFIFSLIIIITYSPISSSCRPKQTNYQKTINRSIAILSIISFAFSYYTIITPMNSIILMSVLFQSLQVIIAKGVKSHGTIKEEKERSIESSNIFDFPCSNTYFNNC
jgi:accessory gene regulator B